MTNEMKVIKKALEENIIKWYPFSENAEILTIRNTLEEINNKKYDYVILLGTLEHADKLFEGKNPQQQLIEYAKNHLKENGKILIAIDNKLGLESICKKSLNNREVIKLNKNKIEELLKTNNLNYYKFYYVLPDYEVTNVIFTDDFLPNKETIQRNIVLNNDDEISIATQNKNFVKLLEQNPQLFKIFTNSYFIECSEREFEDNKIKFISFSNIRKQEYYIQTIIKENKVYKTAGNEKANQHIENIKSNIDKIKELGFYSLDNYEDDVVISNYQQSGQSLDNILKTKMQNGEKEEAVQLIKSFFDEIKIKLTTKTTEKNIFQVYGIPYEKHEVEDLTFTKYGFWDLIFQNAFYIDNKFFFYDQEWKDEGVPIEYIFYRSIQYTRDIQKYLDINKIWADYGIKEKHIKLFHELDNKLQEKIRDNYVWKWHSESSKTVVDLIQEIEQLKKDKEKISEDCTKLLNEKDARIVFLEENMEKTVELLHQKENEVAQMVNSTSWKITKPLRNIKKGKKGENNENKR